MALKISMERGIDSWLGCQCGPSLNMNYSFHKCSFDTWKTGAVRDGEKSSLVVIVVYQSIFKSIYGLRRLYSVPMRKYSIKIEGVVSVN